MSQSTNLVFNGGSIPGTRGQSDWSENNPHAPSYIKNKPNIDNGRIHRLRPISDEVIGETSNYGGWVLDLESQNESAPGGYDRLTPQRLKQILDNGEFLVMEVFQSGDYIPLALQALVDVQNENPLRIKVEFVSQCTYNNLLGFLRMAMYTPTGEESYIQMLGIGRNASWYQDKEALAINGDGGDVTVDFTEAQTRTNIGTGEKLSVLFGKIKKWFTDLKALAFKDKADLTQDVSGVLPIANGGTNANTTSGARTNLDVYSKSEVDNALPQATSTTPSMDGTASVGSETRWAKGDHVHPTDTSREAAANKKQTVDPTSTTDFASSKAIADFVNSSIATNTANFLGTYDVVNDLGLTPSATNAQIATALGSYQFSTTPTNNDYVFASINIFAATDDDEYRRFKFNGTTWAYEYTLNNSGFTAAQIAAIDSGMTAADKSAYDAHLANTSNPHGVTKAQVGLGNVDNTSDATKKSNFTGAIAANNAGFVTGDSVYTALRQKQDAIIEVISKANMTYALLKAAYDANKVIIVTENVLGKAVLYFATYETDSQTFICSCFRNDGNYFPYYDAFKVDSTCTTPGVVVSSASDKQLMTYDQRRLLVRGSSVNNDPLTFDNDVIFLKYSPLYNAAEIDANNLSTVSVTNCRRTVLKNVNQSTLTIRVELESYGVAGQETANFVIELEPSVNCTITVQTSENHYATPHWVTLFKSSSAGNQLEAGKYYQLTCVGKCWTIAEFE